MKMKVPAILASVAAAAAYAVFQLTERLAQQSIADSFDDPALREAAVHRLQGQFVIYGLIALVLAATGGWLFGRALMRPFRRITDVLAGGGTISATSRLAEAFALEQAMSRREVERHVHSAALAASNTQMTQLVGEISEGVIHIDGNGRVLQANPAAVRMLVLPEDAVAQNIISLIRNADVRQIIKRGMLGETIAGEEVILDTRQLLINAHPTAQGGTSAPGERHSTVVTIVDLTALRRLEGVRRDFVANVSHELKTPLTSIHGYVETLRADDGIPAEVRKEFLEIIDRNALRLQAIVDDLLDLSRIESGAWQPDLEDVDVAQVAADVWTSCRELDRARAITFAAPPPGQTVRADAIALRHILANVIGNAVRYTPEGGSITVTVTDSTSGDGVPAPMRDIRVTDTGAGIPREAIPRIFERFYRADPARSREAGGTGLGLAIAKHLAESMHGSVSAASTLGKGTTITITLPAA